MRRARASISQPAREYGMTLARKFHSESRSDHEIDVVGQDEAKVSIIPFVQVEEVNGHLGAGQP
jgi:hypothetical protein